MRVVAITPNYPFESMVGAWIATHSFLRRLTCLGHQVIVFPVYGSRAHVLDGVQVLSGRDGIIQFHREAEQADVIVCHAGFTKPVMDWLNKKPVVCFVHGSERPVSFDGMTPIFNSEHAAAGYEGVHEVCTPLLEPERHLVERTGDHHTIVNLSKPKGIDTVWGAARLLPQHKFLGVKGGYGKQEVPPIPWFRVRPSTTDMRTVWVDTKVLLAPSWVETWGMIGLEAGLNRIPILAYPNKGFQESLKGGAWMIDNLDGASWVEPINQMLDPAVYAVWADRAFERAQNYLQFEQPESVRRFIDVMEGVSC